MTDKVIKWRLPVEQLDDDYVINLPDDLLEAVGWKEGDTLLWEVHDDGGITLRSNETN